MTIHPQQVWTPIAGLLFGVAAFTTPCQQSAGQSKKAFPNQRFTFSIPRNAPLTDLLPTPPAMVSPPPSPWNNDMAKVPEVFFGEPVSRNAQNAMEQTARILAKINHLNDREVDGFMTALLSQREDLRGMPFLLGEDCRADRKQAQLFATIANIVRNALFEASWDKLGPHRIAGSLLEEIPDFNRETSAAEPVIVSAMMQMITPGSKLYGPRLPQRLAEISYPEAARALAKLALFSPDGNVRQAAIDGLKARSPDEYTDELLEGFRYPLPAAAERSAEAFVKLGRKDIRAKLALFAEQPDPRAPKSYWIDGKNYRVLRELVRVNHHRNCVLCHAPGNASDALSESLLAEIPMPNVPFGRSPGSYSFGRSPEIMVRFDMTYLRQDFSLVLPVTNAKPWPNEQRFDFFVRTRVISAEEAAECDRQLSKTPQPYQAAALQAVLTLTSGAASSTPQAGHALSARQTVAKSTPPMIPPATQPAANPTPVVSAAHDPFTPILAFVGTVFIVAISATIGLFFVARMQ